MIWKGKRRETLECLPTHVVQNAVKRIGSRQTKSTDNLKLQFHLFELSQSVSCLSPFAIFKLPIIHLVYHPKVCITVASNFSWVLRYYSLPNRNQKQYLCKIWGGLSKLYYGQCEYGELQFWSKDVPLVICSNKTGSVHRQDTITETESAVLKIA